MSDAAFLLVIGAYFLGFNLLGAAMGGRHSRTRAGALKATASGLVVGLLASIVVAAWVMWGKPYNAKIIWIGPVVGTFVAWATSHRLSARSQSA